MPPFYPIRTSKAANLKTFEHQKHRLKLWKDSIKLHKHTTPKLKKRANNNYWGMQTKQKRPHLLAEDTDRGKQMTLPGESPSMVYIPNNGGKEVSVLYHHHWVSMIMCSYLCSVTLTLSFPPPGSQWSAQPLCCSKPLSKPRSIPSSAKE